MRELGRVWGGKAVQKGKLQGLMFPRNPHPVRTTILDSEHMRGPRVLDFFLGQRNLRCHSRKRESCQAPAQEREKALPERRVSHLGYTPFGLATRLLLGMTPHSKGTTLLVHPWKVIKHIFTRLSCIPEVALN